jgi:hypothetical protein
MCVSAPSQATGQQQPKAFASLFQRALAGNQGVSFGRSATGGGTTTAGIAGPSPSYPMKRGQI